MFYLLTRLVSCLKYYTQIKANLVNFLFMNLKKTIIGTLLVLSASYAAAAYYGDSILSNLAAYYSNSEQNGSR